MLHSLSLPVWPHLFQRQPFLLVESVHQVLANMNQLAFKHSSLSRPLKLSTYAFCIGGLVRGGWINGSFVLFFAIATAVLWGE